MATRVELAPEVADDFERILDHLVQHGVDDAASGIEDTVAAIDAVERNPRIGRPAGPVNRELVIGRRSRGYLALYRYIVEIDTVFVLAVRSQSEAGHPGR
jgi:toxin ParE1/3/4